MINLNYYFDESTQCFIIMYPLMHISNIKAMCAIKEKIYNQINASNIK